MRIIFYSMCFLIHNGGIIQNGYSDYKPLYLFNRNEFIDKNLKGSSKFWDIHYKYSMWFLLVTWMASKHFFCSNIRYHMRMLLAFGSLFSTLWFQKWHLWNSNTENSPKEWKRMQIISDAWTKTMFRCYPCDPHCKKRIDLLKDFSDPCNY